MIEDDVLDHPRVLESLARNEVADGWSAHDCIVSYRWLSLHSDAGIAHGVSGLAECESAEVFSAAIAVLFRRGMDVSKEDPVPSDDLDHLFSQVDWSRGIAEAFDQVVDVVLVHFVYLSSRSLLHPGHESWRTQRHRPGTHMGSHGHRW